MTTHPLNDSGVKAKLIKARKFMLLLFALQSCGILEGTRSRALEMDE
jgi:hypothetical protein